MGPESYLDLIDRCLNTCQYLESAPHFRSEVEIMPDGRGVFWKDELKLKEGHLLRVNDRALFDSEGRMSFRKFSYSLVAPNNREVFRFDTHGVLQSVSDPGHVHDSDGQEINFPSCEGIDFGYVMHCLKRHFTRQQQDWCEPK